MLHDVQRINISRRKTAIHLLQNCLFGIIFMENQLNWWFNGTFRVETSVNELPFDIQIY